MVQNVQFCMASSRKVDSENFAPKYYKTCHLEIRDSNSMHAEDKIIMYKGQR